jgi:hypothetical protein
MNTRPHCSTTDTNNTIATHRPRCNINERIARSNYKVTREELIEEGYPNHQPLPTSIDLLNKHMAWYDDLVWFTDRNTLLLWLLLYER